MQLIYFEVVLFKSQLQSLPVISVICRFFSFLQERQLVLSLLTHLFPGPTHLLGPLLCLCLVSMALRVSITFTAQQSFFRFPLLIISSSDLFSELWLSSVCLSERLVLVMGTLEADLFLGWVYMIFRRFMSPAGIWLLTHVFNLMAATNDSTEKKAFFCVFK